MPVPDNGTVRELSVALLATVRFAEYAWAAVGAKVTETVQDEPAARELPQVLVCPNPEPTATWEIAAAALPVLVIVTDRAEEVEPTAWLPKLSEVGEAESVADAVLVPVPLSATVSGLFVALLFTVSDPEAELAAVGVKVTFAVHEAPAARLLPQLLVCPNGDPAETEEIAAAALPVLEIVTACAALVVPTVWFAKASWAGDAVRLAAELLEPLPGKISNSEICAAVQPVFPVKDSCRYWSVVPDGRLIDTVLPVAGLNVYPAEGTSVVHELPFAEPRTESVSVRVDHAVAGGRVSVTEPSEKL
jgi:hypothetical protein